MKNILLGILLLFVTLSSQAQEKKNKNAKHNVEVNGNCEMCKKRIEKAAFSVQGVKSAEYHIDDNTLHLIINEEKCSLIDVENAVAKVGHDTKNIRAADADYEKLHGCCMYVRK